MDNLIERARLTDEEKLLIGADAGVFDGASPARLADAVADAATVKALWAVVDWLAERRRTLFPQEDRAKDGARLLVQQYAGELINAGIERPKVVSGGR